MKKKGPISVEPVAKKGNYPKRSSATFLNRLRTRDLARMTGTHSVNSPVPMNNFRNLSYCVG